MNFFNIFLKVQEFRNSLIFFVLTSLCCCVHRLPIILRIAFIRWDPILDNATHAPFAFVPLIFFFLDLGPDLFIEDTDTYTIYTIYTSTLHNSRIQGRIQKWTRRKRIQLPFVQLR